MEHVIVSPEMVAERHYFLEVIQSPCYIWAIRIVLIAALIAALIIYKKMKGKNEE